MSGVLRQGSGPVGKRLTPPREVRRSYVDCPGWSHGSPLVRALPQERSGMATVHIVTGGPKGHKRSRSVRTGLKRIKPRN